MRRIHPTEVRKRAEYLYVVEGLSSPVITATLGIARKTIQKWASLEGWMKRRIEYRNELAEIRRKTVRLRRALLEKALESLDARDVGALARLENLAARSREKDESVLLSQTNDDDRPPIETAEDAVRALQDAVNRKLGIMLNQPEGLTTNALREVKQALELIEAMQAKQAHEAPPAGTAPSPSAGLSRDAAEEIRRKILGMDE